MLNREQIHYLKEEALRKGLFVEGPVTEDGVLVSFFKHDIYSDTKFIFSNKVCPICEKPLLEVTDEYMNRFAYKYVCMNDKCDVEDFMHNVLGEFKVYLEYEEETQYADWREQKRADNKQHERRLYKDNEFHVYEELDYFVVVVNDETYLLNSYVDVNEFIMNYNLL